MLRRYSWIVICFLFGIFNSDADRTKQEVALIVGDSQSLHSQALLKGLERKRFRYKLYSLKKLKSLPYDEIFNKYIDSATIRLIDQDDPHSFMSIEESHFWADFLSNRGSLTLFADTLSKDEHVYKADLPDYVGFKSKHLDTQVQRIIGSQKDIISKGQTLNIDRSKKRDQIVPRTGSGIDVVYQSQDGTITGIKQQTCNFRMSYFTFLPGEIEDLKIRHNFIERAIDWNLGYALGTGMQAPDFNILLSDGTPTGIYNVYNKLKSVVILEFMATWCSSCAKQLPRMLALKKEFRDADVSFIFISYKETLDIVKSYLKSHPEITWPIAITPDGMGALRYGVKGLPGIFILDSNREVKFINKGQISFDKLKSRVNNILRLDKFNNIYNQSDFNKFLRKTETSVN